MLTQIINARILTPQGWLKDGSVLIRDNKILDPRIAQIIVWILCHCKDIAIVWVHDEHANSCGSALTLSVIVCVGLVKLLYRSLTRPTQTITERVRAEPQELACSS